MAVSHIMSISKILKSKNKTHFSRYCLQCFSSKKVLIKHKEICLQINGKQSIKLRSGSIKFKIYFKQLPVPHSHGTSNNASYTKKYMAHIPCIFAYKVVSVDDRFIKPVVLYKGENAVNKFIQTILKENEYCKKKKIKKHCNKNLVMSVEDEKSFKSINKYWICNKLFTAEDNKVRDHDHVTGKYRGFCSLELCY